MKSKLMKIVKCKFGLFCFIVMSFIIAFIYCGNSKIYRQVKIAETSKIKASQTTVPDGYIGIYTAEEFVNMANSISGATNVSNYILMEDIDMKDYTYEVPSGIFSGVFDGNYHTISNLKIESSSNYVGIFRIVKEGTIRNLTLRNEIVKATYSGTTNYDNNIGGIAGRALSSNIEGVKIIGETKLEDLTTKGAVYTGGLIGYGDANIIDCYVEGEIISTRKYWWVSR